MDEFTNSSIPVMTVSEAVENLSALYIGAIRAGIPPKELPAPFLWGPPGVGKSEGVAQIGEQVERETCRKVFVTDIRLLLFSPVDLRGVPVPDPTRQFSDWLMPRIFAMDGSGSIINLLFLDELSAAPQSVQAAAYQITLDRRIGEHRLPDNCIVIAAGNRTTDQSAAYKMPKALCNRLAHFEIQADFLSWKAWAQQNGIDARIIGYLSFDPSRLCMEPGASDNAYPTPRTWTFASRIIAASGGRTLHPLLASVIGTDTALEFENYCKLCGRLPSSEDILKGRVRDIPKQQDTLFALSAGLVSAVAAKGDHLMLSELENACAYAARFPVDYAAAFFSDLKQIPALSAKLMKCRALSEWLTRHPEGSRAWKM